MPRKVALGSSKKILAQGCARSRKVCKVAQGRPMRKVSFEARARFPSRREGVLLPSVPAHQHPHKGPRKGSRKEQRVRPRVPRKDVRGALVGARTRARGRTICFP